MFKLPDLPEKHFADIDYADSELQIFKFDPKQRQVLLCFEDLSEKIVAWAYGKQKPRYSFRYKVVYFDEISEFQRFETDNEKFSNIQNDYYGLRDTIAILLDSIEVEVQELGFRVLVSFEQSFGTVTFNCKQIKIYELPIYTKKSELEDYYYSTDIEMASRFDSQEFLSNLYNGHLFIAAKLGTVKMD